MLVDNDSPEAAFEAEAEYFQRKVDTVQVFFEQISKLYSELENGVYDRSDHFITLC